jgi:twitching motility protein PilJ
MPRLNLWIKLLSVAAILLAGTLLALAYIAWSGSPADQSTAPGRYVATAQLLRAQSRMALSGDSAAFDAVAVSREELRALERVLSASADSALQTLVDGEAAAALEASVDRLIELRPDLETLAAERDRLQVIAPDLLGVIGNLASALPADELAANQRFLDRFELTVQRLRQNLDYLAAGGEVSQIIQALSDARQYLGDTLAGLAGAPSSLEMVPVSGPVAEAHLDTATGVFGQARAHIAAVAAGSESLLAARVATDGIDRSATTLFETYRDLDTAAVPGASGGNGTLAIALAAAAAFLVLFMIFAYVRTRDYRRTSEDLAQQNERNQQAILRLLDELSNLADGDLTVQATVTEDITGAIADSINFAIEALRELVTTVKDSSMLVDAAAKQTEAASQHLLSASETQVKQAAAASESIARVVMSIEEVSGNAERCSDVARHAVDVAHKGGDAVRRTIEGMNTIRETIQDTSKRIKRLGESSQEIGDIVELIEEIAEQTNILALNASIEASRAGESSRGFAVVADEVQKLAERSSNAARQIDVLVSTIQSDTNEAVVSMERSTTDVVGGALLAENAGAALVEIEQVSHQIASLVHNISSSAKGQTTAASDITENMRVLRAVSSKTTESSAATTSAISKLSELASELRKTVSGFTLPDFATGTGILSQSRVAESLKQGASELLVHEDPLPAPRDQRIKSG